MEIHKGTTRQKIFDLMRSLWTLVSISVYGDTIYCTNFHWNTQFNTWHITVYRTGPNVPLFNNTFALIPRSPQMQMIYEIQDITIERQILHTINRRGSSIQLNMTWMTSSGTSNLFSLFIFSSVSLTAHTFHITRQHLNCDVSKQCISLNLIVKATTYPQMYFVSRYQYQFVF